MANIKFCGNIGKEPELRYTPSQQPVLTFSVSLYTGGSKDNGYKESVWTRCTAWDDKALFLSDKLHKGQKITVEGQPQPPRTYQKDGKDVSAGLEVTVENVELGDGFKLPDVEENSNELSY